MIRLLNLGPAKHEEVVICVANQRIPNVCRIAGAACCREQFDEIFRGHQLGAKDLLTPTSIPVDNLGITEKLFAGRNGLRSKIKNKKQEKKGKVSGMESSGTKHICVAILAHVDAGKTTLAEGILYLNGKVRKLGRVDHGDAFLDTYELEKERGITIFSKQALIQLGERSSLFWILQDMWISRQRWKEPCRCWMRQSW